MQLQKRSKSYDWNKKNSLDETRYRPGNSSECFASKKGRKIMVIMTCCQSGGERWSQFTN